jgi:hypothetical protein
MFDEDNPLGLDFSTPINPLEALGGAITGAVNYVKGAVRYVPQALTDFRRSIKQEAEQYQQPIAPIKGVPSPIETVQSYAKSQERFEAETMEKTASFLESIGAPEPIAGLGAGIVGVALPGPGDIKVTASAGSMVLTPMLGKITIGNKNILGPLGLEKGQDIVTEAQAKFNVKRKLAIERFASEELTAKNTIQELKNTYGKKPKKEENELVYRMFSRAEGALGRAKESLSRAQSNVFEDQDVFFRSTQSKKQKAVEIAERRISRKIPNNVKIQIDEHHGFPKGMSAALFDRMDQFIAEGLAEPDDLLVMARHAARKGALAGDYKPNMINLVKKPHDELHNYLKTSGDELSKEQWKQVAKKAKTPDELLIIFDDLLDRNIVPNVQTAKIWQPMFDLVEDIQKGL